MDGHVRIRATSSSQQLLGDQLRSMQRIAAILVLSPVLDTNYNAVKVATWELTKTAKA